MNTNDLSLALRPAGVSIEYGGAAARAGILNWLEERALHRYIRCSRNGASVSVALSDSIAGELTPTFDTMNLAAQLQLDAADAGDVEREIALAMLAAPTALAYASFEEFAASVRVRRNIALAARSTQLAFETSSAERPEDYWIYDEDRGFTLLPGKPLIEGLKKATQPDSSGRLYSFSCYRATEYVILLGVAQELQRSNPRLLRRLQRQWETRAIMSGPFHDAFLFEYGSLQAPLPPGYYVPGDRLWFRNPDEQSSDVEGYEGSWVFYIGGGLFSNFWKRGRAYDMVSKCVELFHWRDGVRQDSSGRPYMDEAAVDQHVRASLEDPEKVHRILSRMYRLRDPQGVYAEGGCIDASREFPRHLCPGTADLDLPCV